MFLNSVGTSRSGSTAATAGISGAKDLNNGTLGAHVEKRVKERLEAAYAEEANDKGIPVEQVVYGKTGSHQRG